jgi:arylsulfatase A-like enzyme
VERFRKQPGAGKNRNNPELAAMLESIDYGIGMISAKLEELKLANDTIFVFTSDNGGETTVTTNGELHGGKSQLYEGGIRVPLIIRAPGVTKAGAVSDDPVSSIDYYPTLLEAAGAKAPPSHVVDGVSIFKKGPRHKNLCWHYPLDKPHFLGGRSASAIRSGNKKLLEFYDTGACELYDLAADPSETKDIAPSSSAEVAQLKARLSAWRKDVGAVRPPSA